jgi:hypothetical protein
VKKEIKPPHWGGKLLTKKKLKNKHIYQPLPFQVPKNCPNWNFWFENIPSGNPAA